MGKGVGTFILVLILLWLIAPVQTEHMVTSVVNSISSRLDQSARESANNR